MEALNHLQFIVVSTSLVVLMRNLQYFEEVKETLEWNQLILFSVVKRFEWLGVVKEVLVKFKMVNRQEGHIGIELLFSLVELQIHGFTVNFKRSRVSILFGDLNRFLLSDLCFLLF